MMNDSWFDGRGLVALLLAVGALVLTFICLIEVRRSWSISVRARAIGATKQSREGTALSSDVIAQYPTPSRNWSLLHSGLVALEGRLQVAGVPIAASTFAGSLAAASIVGGTTIAVATSSGLLGLICSAGLFFTVPTLMLGILAERRRRSAERQLPEAIRLMIRAVRAGVPPYETIGEVGATCAEPLGGVFRRAYEQGQVGQSIETAMLRETQPFQLRALDFLVVTLSVQREAGGSLAETLEKLEVLIRQRAQMRLKVKALAAEAKTSATIVGMLPIVISFVMYFVAPDYIAPLFSTTAGLFLVTCAGASIGVGAIVMSKLAKLHG